MHTAVVVPTYDERENIEVLCDGVLRVTQGGAHILIVDDNSPDGTGQIADGLARKHTSIHVLHRARKEGLGRAYVAGLSWALESGYELIAHMDADLSHDPVNLPSLVATARSQGKVTIGSRYVEGGGVRNWGAQRVLLSRAANRYVRFVLRMPVRDATSGYRCYPREVLRGIGIENVFADGYAFLVEMAYRAHAAGFGLVEVPIVFTDRRVGKSKLCASTILEAAWVPWRLRVSRPCQTALSNGPRSWQFGGAECTRQTAE